MERVVSNRETYDIVLRDVRMSDLPLFFEQQLNPEANQMAAFTSKNPEDRYAFMGHWNKILRDETINIQTGFRASRRVAYLERDNILLPQTPSILPCLHFIMIQPSHQPRSPSPRGDLPFMLSSSNAMRTNALDIGLSCLYRPIRFVAACI